MRLVSHHNGCTQGATLDPTKTARRGGCSCPRHGGRDRGAVVAGRPAVPSWPRRLSCCPLTPSGPPGRIGQESVPSWAWSSMPDSAATRSDVHRRGVRAPTCPVPPRWSSPRCPAPAVRLLPRNRRLGALRPVPRGGRHGASACPPRRTSTTIEGRLARRSATPSLRTRTASGTAARTCSRPIDPTLTPELQYVALLEDRHLVLTSDTSDVLGVGSKAATGDSDQVADADGPRRSRRRAAGRCHVHR